MPAAVAYAGAYLTMETSAVALGSFLLSNAAVIGTSALVIGGMAYSAEKERQAKADAKNQFNAAQVDRLTSISSAVAPRELVLGRVRKAGAPFYKASTGTYNKDLYLAIALAGHEIDAVEQIYINDVPVSLDGNGNVTSSPYAETHTQSAIASTGGGYSVTLPASADMSNYTATVPGSRDGTLEIRASSVSGTTLTFDRTNVTVAYQYTVTSSNVQIAVHLGAAGQTVDSMLNAAFPADWGSGNIVQGVAYIVVKLTYSETAFPSGAPSFSALVRGAKVYDPRSATTAWSENPALLMRHVYQLAKFGKATVTSTEEARFIAAANACDTSTVYTVGGVAQAARALFTAGTVAPFGTAAKSLFDDLSQAMGGSWAFYQGELYLKAGVYSASVLSLGDADLATVVRNGPSEEQKPIKIAAHRERAKKFNTVNATIWDGAQAYKQTVLTPLQPSAYLSRDGAELVQNVTFAAINYAPQALHVAGIMLRDARDPLTVEIALKMRAYPLELFDTVDLTIARFGWTAKTFMVVARSWAGDGVLQFTFKETTAAITQMDAGFSAQGFAANTNLPSPWVVADVGALTATSGTSELLGQIDGTVVSRMRVSWSPIQDTAVQQAGQVEVQFRRADSSGAWITMVAAGSETSAVTSEVQDGVTYVIRARAVTSLAKGTWGAQKSHTVVGKSEKPSNVATLNIDGKTLSWPAVTDVDLDGYRIKFQYGSNLDWGTASQMHTGLVTSSPYTPSVVPSGNVTTMIKAVDTSGNESAAPAYVITNLGNPLVANVLETIDYDALGWPGTYINASVVGGNLTATQSDPFYVADAANFYSQDTASFYNTNYDALTWISTGYTPSLAAVGSNMTIAWNISANAYSILYRKTGPLPFFGNDANYFYGDDASAFYSGPSDWTTWPGSINAENLEYQFQVTAVSGPVGAVLSGFAVSVDVPDKLLKLNNVSIAAGGTRLTGAIGYFNVIQNIQLTLQGGSTAVKLEITDKSPTLGPLITAFDSSGTSVAATIDALPQGY